MWGLGLLKGLRITAKNWLRGPVTLQYPEEKKELPPRARWAPRMIYFDDDSPRCTACMNCVRTCPDHVLELVSETREDKSKHIERFTWEASACMFCGLCAEVCPFDALEMGDHYEMAVIGPVRVVESTLLEDVDAASAKRHKEEVPAENEPKGEGEAS
jgi:NADH-quinone oxidoreductase subunit I